MTNNEAITKLTNIMHDDHYAWHPFILAAFDMAVDALRGLPSAQPTHNNTSNALKSLDCIDRQAAIDTLKGLEFRQYMEFGEYIGEDTREVRLIRSEKALDALQNLPPAQPEQRWIPCGKCIHADGKHRWCKVLDRTINEDYFCCWAEPFREEGENDG